MRKRYTRWLSAKQEGRRKKKEGRRKKKDEECEGPMSNVQGAGSAGVRWCKVV
jgi:hypothetical protein